MIPKDLFEKVRRIEITTSRLVTDVFAGQYHSTFKGRGIEFDEVREYQWGDDVRSIDWNVTARTGKPHIKKFVEERELTVMIMVDVSASSQFGTVNQFKNKLAAEVAAVLSFAAIRNNDKVGLIIFTDRIEKFIPPRKGLRHVLRVIREVLYYQPQSHLTNLIRPLEYLTKVSPRKTVSFMISDFLMNAYSYSPHPERFDDLKKILSITNRRHDLIAITLNDPKEKELPNCGLISFKDPETQEMILVDSSCEKVRQRYQEDASHRYQKRSMLFRSVGMDFIDLSTDQPFSKALVQFFLNRRRKNR